MRDARSIVPINMRGDANAVCTEQFARMFCGGREACTDRPISVVAVSMQWRGDQIDGQHGHQQPAEHQTQQRCGVAGTLVLGRLGCRCHGGRGLGREWGRIKGAW